MDQQVKPRLACYDWIRVFSCFCILCVHFNATVSGFNGSFLYPNSILPNYYFGGRIYLGDIGVSLFFMLSGATLMYTYRNIKTYYMKRIMNIYPMFWIAYLLVSVYDFFEYKTVGTGNPVLLLYSILGFDGYLCTLGVIPFDFYKIGEWFLGCIILIYLIFPLLYGGVMKYPVLTGCLVLITYGLLIGKIQTISFILRIPEILLGMFFSRYCLYKTPIRLSFFSVVAFVLGWTLRDYIHPLTLCTIFSVLLFVLLTVLSEVFLRSAQFLVVLSSLTYPAFLIHHWLINKMIKGFSLSFISRRDIIAMFAIYVLLTFLLSKLLLNITKQVRSNHLIDF